MRETEFIRQNAAKWRAFEEILQGEGSDPDQLNDLFVQATDDLSYSRTFYPNRSVRVYLNDLAQRTFASIYKGNSKRGIRWKAFWLQDLPLLMFEARRDMLIAFLVFFGAFLAGVLSCAMDPDFPELILGSRYMEMTEENIASGDPMAVYKQHGPFDMALGITANNLYVAFLSFIFGILYAIGSLMILISNGIMLGAFQFFFVQKDLFWESFLTIWVHGTLEISAIVIAGGAGITLGRGLAFPGTYSRGQAFQRSARRGMKIFFGITPLIVLAGIFESYLTRHTETPDVIRGMFIAACLAFVLVYFWWYPRYVAARVEEPKDPDSDLFPARNGLPDLGLIRSAGRIFSDVFPFLQRAFPMVLLLSAAAAVLFCVPVFLLSGEKPEELFSLEWGLFSSLKMLGQFFKHDQVPWIAWLNVPLMAVFAAFLLPRLMGQQRQPAASLLAQAIKTLLPVAFIALVLQSEAWYTNIIVLLFFPFLLTWIAVIALAPEQRDWGARKALALMLPNYSRVLYLFLLMLLTGGLFFTLLDTSLAWTFLNLASWVVRLEKEAMNTFSIVFLTGLTYFFQYAGFAYILSGFGLLYDTLTEISEAQNLRRRIQEIGRKRMLRGLEQEAG